MGFVEKRGKNSWRICARVKVAGQWTWNRTTIRMDPELSEAVQRRDAMRELDRLESRLSGDDPGSLTVRAWSEIWLEKHVAPDGSPVTVANYRHLLESRILPYFDGRDLVLADLTPALLTDWLSWVRSSPRKSTRRRDDALVRPRTEDEQKRLIPKAAAARPLSVNTVLHYYTCMTAMLSAAVRIGYLEHNPMDRVKRPKLRKKKKAYLSEEQAAALVALVMQLPPKQNALKLAVLLALTCGLRLGEVTALRFMDFDKQHGLLDISRALKYTGSTGSFLADPKTEAGIRTVALPPTMVQLLSDAWWTDSAMTQIDDHWRGDWWIVHGAHGAQLHKDTPSKWFRAFADANGFRGVTFHDLRHTHASLLIASGMDVATVAARMGHGSPAVTLSTYTHPFAARDLSAADTMTALLTRAGLPDPDHPAADPAAAPSADEK